MAQVSQAGHGVLIGAFKGVEEARGLFVAERDLLSVGEDFLGTNVCCPAEEVAQGLTERRRRSAIDLTLFIGQAKL